MDLWQSFQYCYNHIRPKSELIRLNESGQAEACLDQSRLVWTSLGESGQVLTCVLLLNLFSSSLLREEEKEERKKDD